MLLYHLRIPLGTLSNLPFNKKKNLRFNKFTTSLLYFHNNLSSIK